MAYTNVKVPASGAKILVKDGKLRVPDNPIIPFVEGDGTGREHLARLRACIRRGG